jgi:DnaK suppressor protein
VDDDRARELLRRERTRIVTELARLSPGGSLEGDENWEPGDRGSEDLFQDELNVGLRTELQAQLAAVANAEARLKDGTYGLSVESGEPIPDARLEALPTAERTVAEEERHRRG